MQEDGPKDNDKKEKESVVKIFTNALEFDYKYPWRSPTFAQWTGSGFVLGGNKLITNAHVASGSVHLEIEIANDSKRYTATLKSISDDCDLALLEVEDEAFWNNVTPLEIGALSGREEKVKVIGFPMGGETVCYTKGIASRMEIDTYAHSGRELMSTQLSAPINPGNSGGPVLNDKGQVCGVVHQGYRGGQNMGYMIPSNILEHFLQQVRAEEKGFPELGIGTQNLESDYLRKHFRLSKDQSGIAIKSLTKLSPCKGILKVGDVILEIDDIPLNNDGSVFINPMKKMSYKYLIDSKQVGDSVSFKILRNGAILDKKVRLTSIMGDSETIIPMEHGKAPTYYIVAGQMVVQPVTENYLLATKRIIKDREKETPEEQMIVINMLLKSGFTTGYRGLEGAIITEVNGKKILNIHDVIWAIESNELEEHCIKTDKGDSIVIPNLSYETQDGILERYFIPYDRSDELPCRLHEDNGYSEVEPEQEEVEEENAAPLLFSQALLGLLGPKPKDPKDEEDKKDEVKPCSQPSYQSNQSTSVRRH